MLEADRSGARSCRSSHPQPLGTYDHEPRTETSAQQPNQPGSISVMQKSNVCAAPAVEPGTTTMIASIGVPAYAVPVVPHHSVLKLASGIVAVPAVISAAVSG